MNRIVQVMNKEYVSSLNVCTSQDIEFDFTKTVKRQRR